MKVAVSVSALVHPTEVQEKVKNSINNIFPVELDMQDFGIPGLLGVGTIETLEKLHLLLREQRILDTARNVLLNGIKDNTIEFSLNKQVAYVGKVNFPPVKESPGSIHVEITADNENDVLKIIDWLAPHTMDGMPVEEIEL